MTIYTKLAEIQRTLKAPKGQTNTFGKYKYRSCEDILEAVKPLLGDLAIIINDDVVCVGERVYVKATATLTDGEHEVSATAFARESLNKKGMDDSQITGTASSYSRKYALNGLLLIDDTKDSDATNTGNTDQITLCIQQMNESHDLTALGGVWAMAQATYKKHPRFKELLTAKENNKSRLGAAA